jgi:hypothetical protein
MWEVWYGLEAANYLDDSGELVADLFFAIEALAGSAGWPQNGGYQQTDELILWHILNHLVIYQRLENERVVRIASVKPD